MSAPDPLWGAKLFGPEERHLAMFDKWRDETIRMHHRILVAGLLLVLAGVVLAFAGFYTPFGIVAVTLGLILAAGGLWIPWRLSFAFHRMWGVYEAGLVAPSYPKGGWEPLVRWSDVGLLRLRRMRTLDPKTKTEGEEFLIRALDKHGWHHRIFESELAKRWAFTHEEAQAFKEGFMAAARAHLPPDKVVREEGISAYGTP